MLKTIPFLMDRYLTPEQKEIFTRIANGESQVAIAEEFNCSQPTISRINKHAIEVLRDKLMVVIETMKQYQILLEEYYYSDVGKTLFLTKEEAEVRLKEAKINLKEMII